MHQRAIQDFDDVIQTEPHNVSAYFARGFSYKALKQFDQAVQDFHTAQKLNPNDERLTLNYAKISTIDYIQLQKPGFEPSYFERHREYLDPGFWDKVSFDPPIDSQTDCP